jgi:hypothetical protein
MSSLSAGIPPESAGLKRGENVMARQRLLGFVGRQLVIGTVVTIVVIAIGHLLSWLIG